MQQPAKSSCVTQMVQALRGSEHIGGKANGFDVEVPDSDPASRLTAYALQPLESHSPEMCCSTPNGWQSHCEGIATDQHGAGSFKREDVLIQAIVHESKPRFSCSGGSVHPGPCTDTSSLPDHLVAAALGFGSSPSHWMPDAACKGVSARSFSCQDATNESSYFSSGEPLQSIFSGDSLWTCDRFHEGDRPTRMPVFVGRGGASDDDRNADILKQVAQCSAGNTSCRTHMWSFSDSFEDELRTLKEVVLLGCDGVSYQNNCADAASSADLPRNLVSLSAGLSPAMSVLCQDSLSAKKRRRQRQRLRRRGLNSEIA